MALTVMPLAAPSWRQRLGEAVDARLGGGIIDLAILAGLAVDRADIDDAAEAALQHAVPRRLAHVVAAAEIGIEHLVPGLAVHLLHGGVAGDAGIVDDHFHRAQFGFDLLDARRAVVEGRDVPFVGLRCRCGR